MQNREVKIRGGQLSQFQKMLPDLESYKPKNSICDLMERLEANYSDYVSDNTYDEFFDDFGSDNSVQDILPMKYKHCDVQHQY